MSDNDFNRIQHFLFTNNLPTGLNYNTNMLLSTVYHEGAEYPFLPPLPLYTGKYKDSYPGGFSPVSDPSSDACIAGYHAVYRGYETNLGTINSSINRKIEQTVDQMLQCYYNWLTTLAWVTGADIIIAAMQGFTNFVSTTVLQLDPEEDPTVRSIIKQLIDLKPDMARYYENQKYTMQYILAEIKSLQMDITAIEDALERAKDPSTRAKLIDTLIRLNEELQEALLMLKNPPKPPGPLTWIAKKLREIWGNIIGLIKNKIAQAAEVVMGIFTPGVFGKWLVSHISMLFNIIGKLFIFVSAGVIIYSLIQWFNCMSSACSSLNDFVQQSQAARLQAADMYYNQMDDLHCGGCCDIKPGPCGCTGGSQGDVSGSCSSNSKPFGLTLLMGSKYIPTYTDSMQIEPQVAPCGRKPGCPPTPNCTLYGKINGYTDPPSEYIANTWLGCGRLVTSKCGGSIHGHECACGWDETDILPCSWDAVLESIKIMVNNIPGIGTAVRGIGGTVGQL